MIKGTFPHESNDPLEYEPQDTPDVGVRHLSLHSPNNSPRPFFCFSRKMSIPAMWGHYADGGQGVCLVFKFPVDVNWWSDYSPLSSNIIFPQTETKNDIQTNLLSVTYTNKRYIPPLKDNKANTTTMISLLSWCFQWEAYKSQSWAYEDEVRIIANFDNADKEHQGMLLFRWPMQFLYGVIVGPKCNFSTSYIKRKIVLSHNEHKCLNIHWNTANECIVTLATRHKTKFEYEAFPFADRLESSILHEITNNAFKLNPANIFSWNDTISKVQKKLSIIRNKRINAYINNNISIIEEYKKGAKTWFYNTIRELATNQHWRKILQSADKKEIKKFLTEKLTSVGYDHKTETINSEFVNFIVKIFDNEVFFNFCTYLSDINSCLINELIKQEFSNQEKKFQEKDKPFRVF